MKKEKVIVNPVVAKKLLNMGNPIVDLKPHNDGSDKTVFIFEITKKFNNDLDKLSKK